MKSKKLYKKLQENKFILSGPCIIENESMVMHLAEKIKKITDDLNLMYIFKASFDKGDRMSSYDYRGPGFEEGLRILEKVKKEFNLCLITDIHESSQAQALADVVDIIQVPAFLSSQTDLLIASGKTNKIVNIKKSQFMNAKDMIELFTKVKETGNNKIMLTERGSMIGLGSLVVDFRQIIDMQKFGYPVIMEVTHSSEKPLSSCDEKDRDRKYAPYMAKLANSIGVNGFFLEVHENPDEALSDGPNMIYLKDLKKILKSIK